MDSAAESTPNTTNRQVEGAAIAYVIRRETEDGRPAQDTRGRGAAADVVAGDRVIEVKAYGGSARGTELWLEPRQLEESRKNPDFWVYVVENVRQGDPDRFTLLRLGGEVLEQLLVGAVERRYFTVPFPTRIYDELRGRS
ncbi:protein NO VEIN domain-containing protein [Kineococcus arenarius]|uniref:protein NO VEIN domain-containing protein n=1 Tax=Kineococcus sp. SYSU DK007 TaxID=3383128 RepID=UPI003D7DF746